MIMSAENHQAFKSAPAIMRSSPIALFSLSKWQIRSGCSGNFCIPRSASLMTAWRSAGLYHRAKLARTRCVDFQASCKPQRSNMHASFRRCFSSPTKSEPAPLLSSSALQSSIMNFSDRFSATDGPRRLGTRAARRQLHRRPIGGMAIKHGVDLADANGSLKAWRDWSFWPSCHLQRYGCEGSRSEIRLQCHDDRSSCRERPNR